jgi:outer membrane lipoprotein
LKIEICFSSLGIKYYLLRNAMKISRYCSTATLALALALAISACSTAPPASLAKDKFSATTLQMAQAQDLVDSKVRWGGNIVSISPGKGETCFNVVSYPLDSSARPVVNDQSEGRFIACASGFYDPAVYLPGREISVAGTLEKTSVENIGSYEYRFPHVRASQIFLWPRRVPTNSGLNSCGQMGGGWMWGSPFGGMWY